MGHCNITDEEFEDITRRKDYHSVTGPVVSEQDRWSTRLSQVFQKQDDGTYWELCWSRGSLEVRGLDPDATKAQVKPVRKTVIEYVIVE
jgi:hypothetical protein